MSVAVSVPVSTQDPSVSVSIVVPPVLEVDSVPAPEPASALVALWLRPPVGVVVGLSDPVEVLEPSVTELVAMSSPHAGSAARELANPRDLSVNRSLLRAGGGGNT